MNKMQVFQNPEFGKIRAIEINGEPWLVGKDVAEALRYSNTKDALCVVEGPRRAGYYLTLLSHGTISTTRRIYHV